VREYSDSGESSSSNHISIVNSSETVNKRDRNKQARSDKEVKTSPVKVISTCDLGGGDSISTKKSDLMEKSVDVKVADAVRESKPENGGGDN